MSEGVLNVGTRVQVDGGGHGMADGRAGTVAAEIVMNDGRHGVVVELDEPLAPEPPFWEEPIGRMKFWTTELRAL